MLRKHSDIRPACELHTHKLWQSVADPDGNSNRYSNRHGYSDGHSYSYSHCHCHCNVYSGAHGEAYSITKTSSDTAPATVVSLETVL